MGPRRNAFRVFIGLLAVLPAACGGGGGSSSALLPATLPAAGPTAPPSTAPVSVAITVNIPSVASTASAARRVHYVSAGTKSVAVTYANSRSTADCTTTCSVTIAVQPGPATFTVGLYDASGGTGHVLSVGSTTTTIVNGQQNVVQIAFGGVAAKLSVALGATTVTAGTPATIPVTVSAQDATGYTIVGPNPFDSPIGLSDDDTSGATSLSSTSVAVPGSSVTLAYNGAANLAGARITAAIAGTTLTAQAALTVQQPAKPTPPPATPTPAPPPPGGVPTHVQSWYYYGLVQVNQSIPAAWMAAHADYVEDDGQYATAFKNAGGKHVAAYSDPSFTPYCFPPFVPPLVPCRGPIGRNVTDESGWFHSADGNRVHRYVDATFGYQEALNPASPAARDAYHQDTLATIARTPAVDYFFADDSGGVFIGSNDHTQMSGWLYGFNAPAVEITTDAQFIPAEQAMLAAAARPVIINGTDPATTLPSYNGTWIDSPNVIGDAFEGCYSNNGGVQGGWRWTGNANGMLMAAAHRKLALCMTTSKPTPANRIYQLASLWMVYDETYTVAAPLEQFADGLTVVPEYDIVPRQPRTSPTSDVGALRSATGAYVREFAACYQAGASIGPCAAVVNPGSTAVAMPPLTGTYGKSLALDDKSAYNGGQALWTGSVPAQLPALGAVVLR